MQSWRNLGAFNRSETEAGEEVLSGFGEQVDGVDAQPLGQVESCQDKPLTQAFAAQVGGNRDGAEQSDGTVALQARAAHQVLTVPRDQHRVEVGVYACRRESAVLEERVQGREVRQPGRCDTDERRIVML